MQHDKMPPVSRRLDYVLQALEDMCAKLDTITQRLDHLSIGQSGQPGLRALMNRKDAAAALGVSEATVSNLVATGELACVKVGSRVTFTPMDLDRFIAANRRDWGSSRWRGKGRRRHAGWEKADQDYLERLNRPDPADKMRPLDDAFRDALAEHGVNYNGQRALRLAGVCTVAKAKTYSYVELLQIKGVGLHMAPRILKAVGKPVPRGKDLDRWG